MKDRCGGLVTNSCLTLCYPMDWRPLWPWDFPGKNTGVGCHFLLQGIFPTQGSNLGLLYCRQIGDANNRSCVCAQSCPALCNPMDYSPPGSSVHGIFQTRILEQVVICFPRGSSWPRDLTYISCVAGGFFTTEPPGKPREEEIVDKSLGGKIIKPEDWLDLRNKRQVLRLLFLLTEWLRRGYHQRGRENAVWTLWIWDGCGDDQHTADISLDI